MLEQRIGFKRKALQRQIDATGLLISGCQSHQTSADAYIDGDYIGACTYYLNKTLESHNWSINYKNLVDIMNNDLAKAGYTQRPELNGSGKLFGNEFLASTGTVVADVPVEIVEGVTYIEPEKGDDDKTSKVGLILIAVVVIGIIAFGFSG